MESRNSQILGLVADRLLHKTNSLISMEKFRRRGIGLESWLKVEAVRAIEEGDIGVEDVRNRGPDLKLRNGTSVELKAATDFNPDYILNGLESCDVCMFLGFAPQRDKDDLEDNLRQTGSESNRDLEVTVMHLGRGWFLGVIES